MYSKAQLLSCLEGEQHGGNINDAYLKVMQNHRPWLFLWQHCTLCVSVLLDIGKKTRWIVIFVDILNIYSTEWNTDNGTSSLKNPEPQTKLIIN